MENKDQAKENILKGVNQKIKRRGIMIALISIITCIVVGIFVYFIFFAKQVPIDAKFFKDVNIEIRMETINELDSRKLPYHHLAFTINRTLLNVERHLYVENDDQNNTATLYFYISENAIQKAKNDKLDKKYSTEESISTNMLLYPELCKTDKINEITKVYYLVYDYNKIKQDEFDKAKAEAILLWEKQ